MYSKIINVYRYKCIIQPIHFGTRLAQKPVSAPDRNKSGTLFCGVLCSLMFAFNRSFYFILFIV